MRMSHQEALRTKKQKFQKAILDAAPAGNRNRYQALPHVPQRGGHLNRSQACATRVNAGESIILRDQPQPVFIPFMMDSRNTLPLPQQQNYPTTYDTRPLKRAADWSAAPDPYRAKLIEFLPKNTTPQIATQNTNDSVCVESHDQATQHWNPILDMPLPEMPLMTRHSLIDEEESQEDLFDAILTFCHDIDDVGIFDLNAPSTIPVDVEHAQLC
mmetsp:Transcript_54341/g.74259  ORF Transcript_54341/g.74259 Transcript_54341/m.74259 type:complete len:214 (-) Transcript_54341:97-738(-)